MINSHYLGRLVKKIAEKNYFLARTHYLFQLGRDQKRFEKPPVLILQMGKVGSTTIVRSLNAINLDRPVYHSHLLNWPRIKETEQQRKHLFLTDRYSHLKRPWLNRFIRNQIDNGFQNRPWKIISLVRDPIARNVSTFFENLNVEAAQPEGSFRVSSEYYGFGPIIVNADNPSNLADIFFNNFRHDTPLEFFDREFKEVLKFDVFSHPFDKTVGYSIHSEKDFDVLLIRLENLNAVAEKAFESFLGIRNFKLLSSNIGEKKTYAPIYDKLKKEITFPLAYMDRYYQSRFMTHFYSDGEISRMRSVWKCRENYVGTS